MAGIGFCRVWGVSVKALKIENLLISKGKYFMKIWIFWECSWLGRIGQKYRDVIIIDIAEFASSTFQAYCQKIDDKLLYFFRSLHFQPSHIHVSYSSMF